MIVGVLGLDAGWPGGGGDADAEAVLLAVSEGGGLPGVAAGLDGIVHGMVARGEEKSAVPASQ